MVVVGFGRTCPRGALPVFSVADEEEAQDLIVQACARSHAGEHYAEELAGAGNQTLDNLARFSHRLALHHDRMVAAGRCRCTT
jgi:hypothetical protein